jgi:regulatory protein
VERALRLLRHRDRSRAQIEGELEARGVEEPAREAALATLERTGLVDDRRFAEHRARTLAERGAADALIRHDLVGAGLDRDVVADALSLLEPEAERAGRIVERRGSSPKTARYLAGKGFPDEIVRAIIARAGDEALG